MKFKVGDKVKIVNKRVLGMASMGSMDQYLGKIMTIEEVTQDAYRMKEDYGEWVWFDNMIAYKVKFTKSDLKDGDIVTYRNGNQRTLKGDIFIDKEGCRVGSLKFYNGNLRNINVAENDIIKVERPTKYKTVFERKEEILDEAEKRYLRGVIRPFRDNIRFISKESNYDGTEYIEIDLENSSGFFPDFKENTMYKGMKLKRGYTLQELGL